MSKIAVNKSQIFQLIVLIVVLPLLAESIYAPGLPALAESFSVSDSMAEATLSVYLFGMSVGVLFWGNLSDIVGRKPVLLSGFVLFLIATVGCYEVPISTCSGTTVFASFWRFSILCNAKHQSRCF